MGRHLHSANNKVGRESMRFAATGTSTLAEATTYSRARPYPNDLARLHSVYRRTNLGTQWPKIVELCASDGEDYDSKSQFRYVLLEGQVAIRCTEDIERFFGSPKQLTVLDSRPAGFIHSLNLKASKIATQRTGNIFIEENSFHATFARRACPACSKNAIACWRRTLGKWSRNSSRS